MFSRESSHRRFSLGVLVAFTAVIGSACSAGPGRQANPVAPSAVATPEGTQATRSDPDPQEKIGTPPVNLPPDQSGPSDVTFPPRNEPLLFRTALEAKYRDGLRRPSVNTFVDQEGTVVWTQEYLRYRVNLCPHTEAVARVFRQIDGLGIQPTCGSTATVIFPPRNEPLDFMVQLEAKYRDGLRRPAGPSFVDVEGNIVWTQEYLRYRVSTCAHTDAQQKVFDQIDGRGVQADCAAAAAPFNGTWRGTVRSTSCSASGFLASQCGTSPSVTDTLTLVLTQNGSNVGGTINVGGFPATASGTATGTRLSISGRNESGGIVTSYESWDTSLSGSSMTGTFVIGLSAPGLTGFARYTMSLSTVSKIAGVPGTVFRAPDAGPDELKAVIGRMRSTTERH